MTPELGEVYNGAPVVVSAGVVFLLQAALKNRAWYQTFVRLVPGADKYAHWIIAGGISLVAALGIHWSSTWTPGQGGLVTFQIPNLAQLYDGGTHWFEVSVMQQVFYRLAHRDAPDAEAIKLLLRDLLAQLQPAVVLTDAPTTAKPTAHGHSEGA